MRLHAQFGQALLQQRRGFLVAADARMELPLGILPGVFIGHPRGLIGGRGFVGDIQREGLADAFRRDAALQIIQRIAPGLPVFLRGSRRRRDHAERDADLLRQRARLDDLDLRIDIGAARRRTIDRRTVRILGRRQILGRVQGNRGGGPVHLRLHQRERQAAGQREGDDRQHQPQAAAEEHQRSAKIDPVRQRRQVRSVDRHQGGARRRSKR